MLKDDRLGTAQVESLDFLVPESVHSSRHDAAQWVTVGLVSGRLVNVPCQGRAWRMSCTWGWSRDLCSPFFFASCWPSVESKEGPKHIRRASSHGTIFFGKRTSICQLFWCENYRVQHTPKVSISVKCCCWIVLKWIFSVCLRLCPVFVFPAADGSSGAQVPFWPWFMGKSSGSGSLPSWTTARCLAKQDLLLKGIH